MRHAPFPTAPKHDATRKSLTPPSLFFKMASVNLDEATLRAAHQQIDRDTDERKARLLEELEAEARRKHEALDTAWEVFKECFPSPFVSQLEASGLTPPTNVSGSPSVSAEPPSIPPPTQQPSNGTRTAFKTYKAVTNIIEELPDDADINQPLIYDQLYERHDAIRKRGARSVRGQIPSILNLLAKRGVLYVHEKAYGQTPAVYRKKIKQEGPTNEPAVSAAGSLLPASEHKEDLPIR